MEDFSERINHVSNQDRRRKQRCGKGLHIRQYSRIQSRFGVLWCMWNKCKRRKYRYYYLLNIKQVKEKRSI
nr:MAG TPA: hypothetical protein [Caudoviricetes sp.]